MSTGAASGTGSLTRPVSPDDGDHERLTHYVPTGDLERALFDGVPCTALCGKTWLAGRDPHKFPMCPVCKQIWERLSPA
jgi:hypothetical protein